MEKKKLVLCEKEYVYIFCSLVKAVEVLVRCCQASFDKPFDKLFYLNQNNSYSGHPNFQVNCNDFNKMRGYWDIVVSTVVDISYSVKSVDINNP